MTWLGALALISGLMSYRWALIRTRRVDVAFFFIIYMTHVVVSYFTYQLAQTSASDSALYFYDTAGFYSRRTGFGLSTAFVVYSVQFLRETLGGTYLDYFLIFQTFGFLGLATLMRIFQEIFLEIDEPQPTYTYFILLLPGLHFWTSSIGKDAPLFFGVTLVLWASMLLTQRYLVLMVGICIVGIFRPHIGLICMAAVALTIMFERRTKIWAKYLLTLTAIVGTGLAIISVQSAFDLNVTNADAVSDFLASRGEIAQQAQEGMNTAVLGASFPLKLFSLLFRPLFLDASGALAFAASCENLVFLWILMIIFIRIRSTWLMVTQIAYARFAMVYFVMTALSLALVYYNVGLGLRQKTMFVPAVLVLFVTVRALQRRSSHSTIEQAPRMLAANRFS